MILYVNANVRTESRTNRLAQALLDKLGDYEEIKLKEMNLQVLDEERLNKRTALIEAGQLDHEMFALARQWANADTIVVAAPFWDLSFPTILKAYIENIYVTGIVSAYGPDGRPQGLCKAKKLYYVTTAGGPYEGAYSYGYISAMAKDYFGIPETKLIKAEMMDVWGFDPEEKLNKAIEEIEL